jgi:hypothetical protein
VEDRRLTYLALSALGDRYAGHRAAPAAAPEDLTRHELRVFSQNGEDGVIEAVLRRTGLGPDPWFVEFGIGRGVEGNCVFLADVLGWPGLFMESDPGQFGLLEHKYAARPEICTVHATVRPDTIDGLIAAAGLGGDPTVLSIDVDSTDYWIWRAVTLRPRLVVIEYNAHLPPDAVLTQPPEPAMSWDESDYFGASLGALRHLAASIGYRLVHTDLAGVNAFFVRGDLADGFQPEERVVVRSPNFSLLGGGHRPHEGDRTYVDPRA